jgi:hypothetical protein
MIAPVFPKGRRLLPPEKAKHAFGSCQSEGCKLKALKYKGVAAVWLGRQQLGISSCKKYLDPSAKIILAF